MTNVKAIWDSQQPTEDILIKRRIDEISHLDCFLATNNITGQHLYIMSVSKNEKIPELDHYRFKGVEFFAVDLESTTELNIYLLDNELKDIFSLFVQNIIDDIINITTQKEAIIRTLNVVSRWKRLFDIINFKGLNTEQQKGLTGELLFINFLLDRKIPSTVVLNAWTGSDFEDKDFVFGSVGVEVKLTSSKNPKLKIASERQLDSQNLDELFLVLYTCEEVKANGFSLNSLVEETQLKFSANRNDLVLFNEKLLLLGYLIENATNYNTRYSLKKEYCFVVTSDFPKIVTTQLPFGVYNTSYFIELSAAVKFLTNSENIIHKI